eukprot:scaffold92805_cov22-Prasinocladus_malaysianus.AAC.1
MTAHMFTDATDKHKRLERIELRCTPRPQFSVDDMRQAHRMTGDDSGYLWSLLSCGATSKIGVDDLSSYG